MDAPLGRAYRDAMTKENRAVRAVFGRPSKWVGPIWMAVGVIWLVVTLVHPGVFHVVMTVLWLGAGLGMTLVAQRDRRLGRGRFRS